MRLTEFSFRCALAHIRSIVLNLGHAFGFGAAFDKNVVTAKPNSKVNH